MTSGAKRHDYKGVKHFKISRFEKNTLKVGPKSKTKSDGRSRLARGLISTDSDS